MSAHENLEHVEHAEHASHGGNKKIALLISVLALFLAFSETLGKSAQTAAITENVHVQRPLGLLPGQDTSACTILRTAPSTCRSRPIAPPIPPSKRGSRRPIEELDRRPRHATTTTRKAAKAASSSGRARQASRAQARPRHGALSQLRIRFGRLPDRHRAGLGASHHRHGRAWAGCPGCSASPASRFTGLGLWAPHALDFLTHAAEH